MRDVMSGGGAPSCEFGPRRIRQEGRAVFRDGVNLRHKVCIHRHVQPDCPARRRGRHQLHGRDVGRRRFIFMDGGVPRTFQAGRGGEGQSFLCHAVQMQGQALCCLKERVLNGFASGNATRQIGEQDAVTAAFAGQEDSGINDWHVSHLHCCGMCHEPGVELRPLSEAETALFFDRYQIGNFEIAGMDGDGNEAFVGRVPELLVAPFVPVFVPSCRFQFGDHFPGSHPLSSVRFDELVIHTIAHHRQGEMCVRVYKKREDA